MPGGVRTIVIGGLVLLGAVIWLLIRPTAYQQQSRILGAGGPIPVGVAQASVGNVAVTLDALGTVAPLATVTVKPQVSGILYKLDFQEGQMVKAGDVLAEIDPRPFQAALDQAKGQLLRDQAQLANAKVDLGRYQALWVQKSIAQQTLATQSALVRTDEGTVKADQAAVDAAAINLSFCRITSPIAGRVGLRQVDVGNLVQSGTTTAIVIVTQLQPISVLFTLPEDDINAVMARVGSGAKLTADAYDRAQTTKLATGSLSTIDNEVDPTTGTVKLRAMFDNSDNRLFPQQFVNIRLLVNTLQKQTTVPAAAIQRGSEGNFVYVVNRDHTVNVRAVTLGPTDNDRVDITNGLRPGEVVVVDGADRLKDGARISMPGAGLLNPGVGGKRSGQRRHHRASAVDSNLGGGP